ncbi:ethanolamine utilization protein EutN [Rhodococcus sp. ACS1]|uniref:EutN/CcmL family microcompartment protein n=1 Tax=Rhodococcus sp. ACS1 TaxID=2028570 RepID=UPI000BB0DD99|nr:EutN/CcmL family microcompartment protein [Rhodococcus sp. ACS1]PBC35091.1 ethanolamine utilization protein EutN [Rhodococcus sp. ACS1]
MRLARVVGQVVSTAKVPELSGTTILVVEDIAPEPGGESRRSYAAIDLVGAGQDEVVLVVSGSAARVDQATTGVPVDQAIVAIADTIVTHGEVTYSK